MNNKVNTAGKPLRKTALKSIIALVLCMTTIIGGIGVGANKASAAKIYPLKVQFKGKSVTIFKDNEKGAEKGNCPVTLQKLKKKWGKPNKTKGKEYTWKKGNTTITYTDYKIDTFYDSETDIEKKAKAS